MVSARRKENKEEINRKEMKLYAVAGGPVWMPTGTTSSRDLHKSLYFF
jgi:hypothetical protein